MPLIAATKSSADSLLGAFQPLLSLTPYRALRSNPQDQNAVKYFRESSQWHLAPPQKENPPQRLREVIDTVDSQHGPFTIVHLATLRALRCAAGSLSSDEQSTLSKYAPQIWTALVALGIWEDLDIDPFPGPDDFYALGERKIGSVTISRWGLNAETKPSSCTDCARKQKRCLIIGGASKSQYCRECALRWKICSHHDPTSYKGPGQKRTLTPEERKTNLRETKRRCYDKYGGTTAIQSQQKEARARRINDPQYPSRIPYSEHQRAYVATARGMMSSGWHATFPETDKPLDSSSQDLAANHVQEFPCPSAQTESTPLAQATVTGMEGQQENSELCQITHVGTECSKEGSSAKDDTHEQGLNVSVTTRIASGSQSASASPVQVSEPCRLSPAPSRVTPEFETHLPSEGAELPLPQLPIVEPGIEDAGQSPSDVDEANSAAEFTRSGKSPDTTQTASFGLDSQSASASPVQVSKPSCLSPAPSRVTPEFETHLPSEGAELPLPQLPIVEPGIEDAGQSPSDVDEANSAAEFTRSGEGLDTTQPVSFGLNLQSASASPVQMSKPSCLSPAPSRVTPEFETQLPSEAAGSGEGFDTMQTVSLGHVSQSASASPGQMSESPRLLPALLQVDPQLPLPLGAGLPSPQLPFVGIEDTQQSPVSSPLTPCSDLPATPERFFVTIFLCRPVRPSSAAAALLTACLGLTQVRHIWDCRGMNRTDVHLDGRRDTRSYVEQVCVCIRLESSIGLAGDYVKLSLGVIWVVQRE
ncbi:hypothetical protein CYLTODRAFT_480469 [Cylindrobasidium torrendii FP15055 ss-10]|uniref:Uncharacterized protein n=1 Tax=Cylindrobasidium torrendii FP15055 ss-10 TaxID=1314674 RepID=A0A0D7ASW7_9AGAR|nr:hypothetical protein CYLTODRAFT_480469 [Cylindrobasidium torrendii FP15055 ss-10]